MAMPPDRSMDAALRNAMRAGSPPPSGCDAELTAAYAEGRLIGAERLKYEGHLAECAPCRLLAAELIEAVEPAPHSAKPTALWWRWRWAAPALAGVAIVGSVMLFQTEPSVHAPAPAAQEQPAVLDTPRALQDSAPASAPAAVPRRDSPAQRAKAAPSTEGFRDEAPKELARQEAPAPAAPPAPAAADVLLEKSDSQRRSAAAASESVIGRVAGVTKDKAAGFREEDRKVAPTRLITGESEFAQKNVAAPRAQSAALSSLPALPGGAAVRAVTRHDDRLWAVSDGGRIFRSTDGGKTWTSIDSPTTADLTGVHWDPQANLLVVKDHQGTEYRVKP